MRSRPTRADVMICACRSERDRRFIMAPSPAVHLLTLAGSLLKRIRIAPQLLNMAIARSKVHRHSIALI